MLTAASLPRGACLPPIHLTRRGNITRIALRAFVAGDVPLAVAERMVAAAEMGLKKVRSQRSSRSSRSRGHILVILSLLCGCSQCPHYRSSHFGVRALRQLFKPCSALCTARSGSVPAVTCTLPVVLCPFPSSICMPPPKLQPPT